MSSRNSYLLSILIPTKNRYETLIPLLEYLTTLDKQLIEIVIQDNSENNSDFKIFLKNCNYKNIKYFYTSKNISVIDNFNNAINNSSGEYICMIGDDDGVMPYVAEVTKWMKQKNIKCVKADKPEYFWPGQKSSFLSSNSSGILHFKKISYKVNRINSNKELSKVLSKGGVEMCKLPSVYHGIIHKSSLEQLKNLSNSYFPGASPDMANAIGLTKFKLNSFYLNFPLFITGKQIKSTGGKGTNHNHVAEIKDVNHLPKNVAKTWDERIPKYWTGETIYAQTIISALEKTERKKLISKFNFPYFYSRILIFHFNLRDKIFNNFAFSKNMYVKIIILSIYIFVNRIRSIINRTIFNSDFRYEKIINISKAVDSVMNNVNIKKIESILSE